MLVKMVTAISLGTGPELAFRLAKASAAARIMAGPPSAWTLMSRMPGRDTAAVIAPPTVRGMSWNLRSRKIPAPSSATLRTASGPAAVNKRLPTLNIQPMSERRRATSRAGTRDSKSRATIRRSLEEGLNGAREPLLAQNEPMQRPGDQFPACGLSPGKGPFRGRFDKDRGR